ncbi:MAG: MnhB domain-containing protein [Candidatus Omnitrophica bacterium]|nr:MnhB domain-containing protein [Candidatus Omnitrophota bacterium]
MSRAGNKGMTLIVKTVTRITLGFILLYGIYIALNGETAPGGGFAGGVIVALALVHVMLAFGRDVSLKWLHVGGLRAAVSIAALIFLLAAWPRGQRIIFGNDIILPVCEMVIVGAGLFAIFVALVLVSKADKEAE